MEYIEKLPIILALVMAIVVGVVSILQNIEFNSICVRLIIVMLVSFITGVYLRNIFTKIDNERTKKEQENKKEDI